MAKIDYDSVLSAVQAGDIYHLKKLLDRNVYRLSDIVTAANSCHVINDLASTTLLGIAAGKGHLECVVFLNKRCLANIDGITQNSLKYHQSPLYCAAANNMLNVVDYLMSKGANVNIVNPYDNATPLKAACTEGNYKVVKRLIAGYNADVEIATFDDHTCLMMACELRFVNIVKYLVEIGQANVNRRDFKGVTALHYAAEYNSHEIVLYLIEHNAEINATDIYENTPLSIAILNEHIPLAYFMLNFVDEIEKIRGYELLGAIYVSQRKYSTATAYWKYALNMRQKQNPVYEKIDYASIVTEIFSICEFKTTEDLDSQRGFKMDLQALLVRIRILGLNNPYNLYYLFHLAKSFEEKGKLLTSLKLFICCVETQLGISNLNVYTNTAFFRMAILLWSLFAKKKNVARYFVRVFKLCVAHIERFEPKNELFEKSLTIPLQLIEILTTDNNLNDEQFFEVKKYVEYLVMKINPHTLSKRQTLLHLACLEESFTIINNNFPNAELLKMLINAGANSGAKDIDGNTPYHIFIRNYYKHGGNVVAKILVPS